MPHIMTAKQISEEALRAIGEFPVTESAADPEKMRTAMTWLDMLIAQTAGTMEVFSLVSHTIPLTLEGGTSEYDLNEELGADLPADQIQFPREAWIEDEDANRYPLEIVKLDRFEAAFNATERGRPCIIHIDRLQDPMLRTFPTVDEDDPTEWTVKLIVQTYAPNIAPRGVTGTQATAIAHNFRAAWQRYLVLQHSADLAGGPIVKLPQASIENWRKEADRAMGKLEAFENREHETSAPVVEAWGRD